MGLCKARDSKKMPGIDRARNRARKAIGKVSRAAEADAPESRLDCSDFGMALAFEA